MSYTYNAYIKLLRHELEDMRVTTEKYLGELRMDIIKPLLDQGLNKGARYHQSSIALEASKHHSARLLAFDEFEKLIKRVETKFEDELDNWVYDDDDNEEV